MLRLNKLVPKVIRGFVQCACVTYCVYEYVGDIVVCSGPSMEPTLYTNDVLLLERISVRLQRLEKGDIVISKCPNNPEQNICKRIAGLPGDKIRNGFTVTTIPYGHVWLEGDNRNNSTDSRMYGPVPQGLLRGRALSSVCTKQLVSRTSWQILHFCNMTTLRWGIASAGKISHDFVTALRSLPADEHDIIAVAARELSRAKDFARLHEIKIAYDDYAELASNWDIDIVYIGAIHPRHFDIAMLMLKHEKHVLCEKPLTMNLKQTTELINYARSKNLFLMEGVWSRCFPVYDAIRKEIASGNIGDIHQVILSFGFQMQHIERITAKELGGGTILDLGVYCLQLVCLAYNNEMPESIKASGSLNANGVDTSMSAILTYKGNRTAIITSNSLVKLPNEAYVCGTKGMIKISDAFWAPTKVELPSGTVKTSLPKVKHEVNFPQSAGLSYEAAEARNCILKGLIESPKISHDTSLLLAKLEDELRKQLGVVYPED